MVLRVSLCFALVACFVLIVSVFCEPKPAPPNYKDRVASQNHNNNLKSTTLNGGDNQEQEQEHSSLKIPQNASNEPANNSTTIAQVVLPQTTSLEIQTSVANTVAESVAVSSVGLAPSATNFVDDPPASAGFETPAPAAVAPKFECDLFKDVAEDEIAHAMMKKFVTFAEKTRFVVEPVTQPKMQGHVAVSDIRKRLDSVFSDSTWPNKTVKARMRNIVRKFHMADNPHQLLPENCINLYNGRGYTAGIGGFTSLEGDLLSVLEWYREISGSTSLQAYEGVLKWLAENNSFSTALIPDFCCAWRTVAKADPLFVKAQNDVHDALFYVPAMTIADGLKEFFGGADLSSLTKLLIFDAVLLQKDVNLEVNVHELISDIQERLTLESSHEDAPPTVNKDSTFIHIGVNSLRDRVNVHSVINRLTHDIEKLDYQFLLEASPEFDNIDYMQDPLPTLRFLCYDHIQRLNRTMTLDVSCDFPGFGW